jgi:hypothetical protein
LGGKTPSHYDAYAENNGKHLWQIHPPQPVVSGVDDCIKIKIWRILVYESNVWY